MILDWAIELKNVSKVNRLSDEDIERLLCPSGKESRLASVLPLLEFVACSLLSHDTKEDISVLWLMSKQRVLKTVPIRLDPNTSHPLLAFSDDKLEQRATGHSGDIACNDQPIKLSSVNRVGIYLDYEESQVSFYDVEKRSHIYTFSDTFKEGVVPVFACLDVYTKLKTVTPERFQPH
ncbi:unnamed protein product [Coregonus sp. 'balchen']|nr:unnamed protein product [Coregonus sp. 'balchen']